MRYVCLTCDFDGTIARDGIVERTTIEALVRVRASGRKLLLATGRQLDELLAIFPDAGFFDRIVAENGCLLYRPSSKERLALAEPPPQRFIEELERRGVTPLSVGQCIVATWHPQENTVLDVIRDMALELQIIFNKNAVMILPSGVNKGTGLRLALKDMGLSPHNVVGVGDAENDHGFLSLCECRAAVGNALPALKASADWVAQRTHGAGVEELIELILKNDLEDLAPQLKRHEIVLGELADGSSFSLPAYGMRLLIAGPSGGGKSTIVSSIVDRLAAKEYQVCLFDPEGDYDEFEPMVSLGGPDHIPTSSLVLESLNDPSQSVSINLLGVPLEDRPTFFQSLLAHIRERRLKMGRPHWIIVDEAHHLLPKEFLPGTETSKDLANVVLVTVHPDLISSEILGTIDGIIIVGNDPHVFIDLFNRGAGTGYFFNSPIATPREPGYVLAWFFADSHGPQFLKVKLAETERRRHRRKYAVGELGEDKSFYFRGAQGKLNLRAQNMTLFTQLAEGLDDETWDFHLTQGDYSRWLREAIKDRDLAGIVANIESDPTLSSTESRRQVIEAIRKHYTASA